MSRSTSPATGLVYGVARACLCLNFPRSTFYAEVPAAPDAPPRPAPAKRGPKTTLDDSALLVRIRADLAASHFKSEGHRKVWARLRRAGEKVGRNRVLGLMRRAELLSPHRKPARPAKEHNGRITTDAPGVRIATDGAKVWTIREGWVWVFVAVDHHNSECLGWHVCKKGDMYAAYEPVAQARVRLIEAGLIDETPGSPRVELRHDHGSQYMTDWYQNMARHQGFTASYAFVGEPQTNGVCERFNRTWKEQTIHGVDIRDIAHLRALLESFMPLYNHNWQLERHDFKTPVEVRLAHTAQPGQTPLVGEKLAA